MSEYDISYTYRKPSGATINTSTIARAESESEAKNNVKVKHAAKNETIVEWRRISKRA
ncbi:hypothetical protein [Bibersteinia trehalosi]|uniref:hypothetical protein n=1 Tax=Bibersteinia trehalosi TaxID=47735 RepID=UPI002D7A2F13|nr:hypothetical protein [Bibersteinia trehalosi]